MKVDKLENLEIKDKNLITKYNLKYQDFFIPANEHDTFDTELLNDDIIYNSSQIIGQDNPIRIAICENDKEPTSSKFHIHLRIIDGRHRWKQSIKHNIKWATKFYNINDYQTLMMLRGHLDSKKQITAREKEEYFLNLAEHYMDMGIEQDKICAMICNDFCPPFIPETVRRYLPYRFKNQIARRAGQKGKEARFGDKFTVEEIINKNPKQIATTIYGIKETIKQKDEFIDYLLSVHGQQIPMIKYYYVVERKNASKVWVLHTATTDKKLADEIFNKNPSIKIRLSKVTFSLEEIKHHDSQTGKNPNSIAQLTAGNSKEKRYGKHG